MTITDDARSLPSTFFEAPEVDELGLTDGVVLLGRRYGGSDETPISTAP